MMRKILIITVLAISIAGCGDISNWIEQASSRNVGFYKVLHDGESDGAYLVRPLFSGQMVYAYAEPLYNEIDLSSLADAIDLAKENIPCILFYFTGELGNFSDHPVSLSINLVPDNRDPISMAIIDLQPYEHRYLNVATDLSSDPRQVHDSIAKALSTLAKAQDGTYRSHFSVTFTEAGNASVGIASLNLVCTPFFRKTGEISSQGLGGNKEFIKGVKNATLSGSVVNNSQYPVDVEIYISSDGKINGNNNLIAFSTVQPGQEIPGEQMLLPDGADKIDRAIKNLADNEKVYYEYIVSGDYQFNSVTYKLKLDASVEVAYDIGW